MRRSTLLLLLPLTGCWGEQTEMYTVVEDFQEEATPVMCEAVTLDREVAVTQIRPATDSTWLLLDEAQRRIMEITEDYRTRWVLEYPPEGPGSLRTPVGLAMMGDTAIAVVDRGAMRLVILSRTGEELLSTPLGFMPNAVAVTGAGDVLVTPLPFDGEPGTLLVRFRGRAPEELAVPHRYYESMIVRAMGNVTTVATLPDGGALVFHQYLAPRAFAVDADGDVKQLAMPTPDATVSQASFIPTYPLTDEQHPLIMVPAAAVSVDPVRSEVYVLTRSGRMMGEVAERAILRLDDRLGFIEAFTFGFEAHEMVFLPGRGAALVVDDMDRIRSCTLPLTRGTDAQA